MYPQPSVGRLICELTGAPSSEPTVLKS